VKRLLMAVAFVALVVVAVRKVGGS